MGCTFVGMRFCDHFQWGFPPLGCGKCHHVSFGIWAGFVVHAPPRGALNQWSCQEKCDEWKFPRIHAAHIWVQQLQAKKVQWSNRKKDKQPDKLTYQPHVRWKFPIIYSWWVGEEKNGWGCLWKIQRLKEKLSNGFSTKENLWKICNYLYLVLLVSQSTNNNWWGCKLSACKKRRFQDASFGT